MRHRITLDIKPLSVNDAWKGRRFKSKLYQQYERACLFMLPPFKLPDPPYKLLIFAYLSSSASDIDNIVKPFIDILQKKYKFNDKLIMDLRVIKTKVKKGGDSIGFEMKTYNENDEIIF